MTELEHSENESKLAKAKHRAREKVDFVSHFGIYVIVNIFLFTLNALTALGDWWFKWPLIGWGIGVAIHFLGTFVFAGSLESLEKKFLNDELKRHN